MLLNQIYSLPVEYGRMSLLALCLTLWVGTTGCEVSSPGVESPEACMQVAGSQKGSELIQSQGMLLASRFQSFEEFQQTVRVTYLPLPEAGASAREDSMVILEHCSNGKKVQSILAWGVDEGDFLKAYTGDIGEKMSLGARSPFAVEQRQLLKRVFILGRWRTDLFGEGDKAFYDLAVKMVEHINTPDLAYLVRRDSSDKGYLNTFNHVTAQAFMTALYSEELADFVADVHERNTMAELISGTFSPEQLTDSNNNPVDNYVDMINNEWGQELGKRLKAHYNLDSETQWSAALLRDVLNDIQDYYSWGLGIGLEPFHEQDTVVQLFTNKLNFVISYAPE